MIRLYTLAELVNPLYCVGRFFLLVRCWIICFSVCIENRDRVSLCVLLYAKCALAQNPTSHCAPEFTINRDEPNICFCGNIQGRGIET